MARFKRGDRVVIAERETTAADRKSSLYYPHFRGLRGVVDQLYESAGEVCVEVDGESLPPEFARRHQWIEDKARQKWLNTLSESERRSLPEEQKRLRLKYTVMVSADDLAPEGRRARAAAEEPVHAASAGAAPAARRPNETDLSAREAAHLAELARRAQRETP